MEKNLKASLETKYGITALEILPRKHLWKINSLQGKWMIKKYPTKDSIDWLFYIGNELKNKGFTSFAQIMPTMEGKPAFIYEGMHCIVMPYLEGMSASYNNRGDINKTIRILAELHHHGFLLHQETLVPQHRPIQNKLRDRLIDFTKLYDSLLLKKEKGLLELQILSIGKEMIRYGEQAIEKLDYQIIGRLNQEAKAYRMLSHRDLASHNFILGDRNYIIDFDLSSFEPQAFDLWQILSRMLTEWQWNPEILHQLENTYQLYRKLHYHEQIIIRQLLKYPNDFFRESLGAYYLPKKYKRENVNKFISKYTDHFSAYQDFQRMQL